MLLCERISSVIMHLTLIILYNFDHTLQKATLEENTVSALISASSNIWHIFNFVSRDVHSNDRVEISYCSKGGYPSVVTT